MFFQAGRSKGGPERALWKDMQYGFRMLARSLSFTIVALRYE